MDKALDQNCAFCTDPEIKEREVVRNELAWAFPTRTPIVPGHILICPIRHAKTFEDMTESEKNSVFELMQKIKSSLIKSFSAKGFNHAWNENDVGGQSVPHFHLHVLPRVEETEVFYDHEPRQFLYRTRAKREISPREELLQVAALIRKNAN